MKYIKMPLYGFSFFIFQVLIETLIATFSLLMGWSYPGMEKGSESFSEIFIAIFSFTFFTINILIIAPYLIIFTTINLLIKGLALKNKTPLLHFFLYLSLFLCTLLYLDIRSQQLFFTIFHIVLTSLLLMLLFKIFNINLKIQKII